jgi:hypothetical protein
MKIIIVLQGGLVRSVFTKERHTDVEVIDLDQTDSLARRRKDEKRVNKLEKVGFLEGED